jgi:hypothetical protein
MTKDELNYAALVAHGAARRFLHSSIKKQPQVTKGAPPPMLTPKRKAAVRPPIRLKTKAKPASLKIEAMVAAEPVRIFQTIRP